LTKESEIIPVLVLSVKNLSQYENKWQELSFLKDSKSQFQLEFHLICESYYDFSRLSQSDSLIGKNGVGNKNQIRLVYVITKRNLKSFRTAESSDKKWSKFYPFKSHFYFPYKTRWRDFFLTPKQVYGFLQKATPLPRYPLDTYDKRIPESTDLAPLYKPFLETTNELRDPYFSIIIPSYNSGKQLLNSLSFLAEQDFPKKDYEVIVVDDGSPDFSRERLIDFSKKNPLLNIKGIHFPRVIEKRKGMACFRAGLARNLGVKHSRGKCLAFLDSDILVPSDYLVRLKKDHEKADLVLVKRFHLKEKQLSLKPGEKFKESFLKKTYIEEESYWGSFYKKGFDGVTQPWKYVCSYGLSLSRKDFDEVGAFGKNFLFYGFEDTDLGYQFFKKKKKMLLSDTIVFHQKDSLSLNHFYLRQKQLMKTAKIFYYRHLDSEIYKALKVYMRQERSLFYFLR